MTAIFPLACIHSNIKLWAHLCNQVWSMLTDSDSQKCCKTNLFCTELLYTSVTPHELGQVKPRICAVALASFI